MKQKLLNSFTWRASLLVALLCTSFGNAWGEDYTQNIVFASGSSISTKELEKTFESDAFTGYLRSVVIEHNTPNGQPKGTVTISFNNIQSNSGSLNFSTGQYTYSASGDTYHGKNAKISVTIKNTGNKSITVNSITVTYTPTTSITLSENCYDVVDVENNVKRYYGTYSNPKPFVVPEGLTVHTVSANASGVLAVADFEEGTTIPANTGVMVSSSEAGEKIVKMANPNPTSPYSPLPNNMLKPTGDNGITRDAMAATGSTFYYLTMNGDQIGFYRRNEDGDAFAMPANKAYLAISSSTGEEVKGFAFGDGTNGIKAVETTETESKAIYNLAGQRVSKMQKGIYVVNGKKMLVK